MNVSFDKKDPVQKHRKTAKHQNGLKNLNEGNEKTKQLFMKITAISFVERVVRAFLCADIPLHKVKISMVLEILLTKFENK